MVPGAGACAPGPLRLPHLPDWPGAYTHMVVILHAAIGAGVWFERFVLLAPRVLIRPVTILATELAIPLPKAQPYDTIIDGRQVPGDLC